MAEQPRRDQRAAPRYSLIAEASVTDVASGARLNCRTYDIGVLGCYLDTMNPFPGGTRVQVRVTHRGETFEAAGVVRHFQPNMGMGVHFVEIAPEQQARLQKWLAELSGASQS